MGTDFYAFEMLTGRRLTPLPAHAGTWKMTTNADESITCSMKGNGETVGKLRVWEATQLATSGLLAVVDDVPVAAGPIWKRKYTQGGDIEFTAGGLRSYWERRLLLPLAARTTPLVNGAGDPDPALDFAASNLSLGTIAKRYIELVRLWPGGAIPMTLPDDEAGTASDTVKAIDLKSVRKLLDALTDRQNGPDIAFRPRWSDDGLGIYWEMQTGTNANPRLGNTDPDLAKWSVGGEKSTGFGLEVEEDGTDLAEEVFFTGGGSADRIVTARARDTALADAGYPLMQKADTGHSDVVVQATADGYAAQGVALSRYPAAFWSMNVRAHERGAPMLGDYWLGDLATVTVDEAEPILPAGDYVRRIASISGDIKGEAFDLTFAEAVAA